MGVAAVGLKGSAASPRKVYPAFSSWSNGSPSYDCFFIHKVLKLHLFHFFKKAALLKVLFYYNPFLFNERNFKLLRTKKDKIKPTFLNKKIQEQKFSLIL